MARPSKKTLELRSKILELKVFKRDNSIYTSFEKSCSDTNKFYIPYKYMEECRNRKVAQNLEYSKKLFYGNKNFRHIATQEIEEAININERMGLYFFRLLVMNTCNFSYAGNRKFNYSIDTFVNTDIIEKITNKSMESYSQNGMCSLYEIEDELSDEMNKKILEAIEDEFDYCYKPYRIRIEHNKIFPSMFEYMETPYNKTVDIEMDLTKPKEELLSFIEQLKNDYDNKNIFIKTPKDILSTNQEEDFICNLKDCDIYKDTKSPKPISGRLADVLFIYDCKKVNELLGADILTNEYITDEINRYWQEVKNISPDGFSSLGDYYAIAKEYIDEQKYKDYVTGVKHTL